MHINRTIKLPFSNATMHSHTRAIKPVGRGMGSVLLRTAGGGAGSSYFDMDDYIETTGINPSSRGTKSTGQGLSKLANKLSKLNVTKSPVRKNIIMSI